MSAMLPVCDDLLGLFDGSVAWLGFLASAIDDGRLVIRPGLNASAAHDLHAELAKLQGVVLPSLRETAKRSREHAQRYYTASR